MTCCVTCLRARVSGRELAPPESGAEALRIHGGRRSDGEHADAQLPFVIGAGAGGDVEVVQLGAGVGVPDQEAPLHTLAAARAPARARGHNACTSRASGVKVWAAPRGIHARPARPHVGPCAAPRGLDALASRRLLWALLPRANNLCVAMLASSTQLMRMYAATRSPSGPGSHNDVPGRPQPACKPGSSPGVPPQRPPLPRTPPLAY